MPQLRTPSVSIAVVGVSALFPGSLDKSGFWRDILAGRDLVTDVPASHWLVDDYYDPNPAAPDKTYSKRGAFLPDIDFDPILWGVPPSVVPATDTCQLLALIVAQQVLEDACQGQFAKLNRERASVILGVTSAQELLGSMVSRLQRPVWVKALRETGLPEAEVTAACDRIASHYTAWQESTFPGVLGNVVAGRIANRLNLGGTNCVTDAACASSLSALSMGVNELVLGQSDLAICGGADTMNDIFMYMCFSKTPALSKSGDCRPFSDRADGTLLGEGIGMVALKRLDDAERDGDRVYAVLRGIGTSSDGRAKSVYAPVADGQARALRRAYAQAGYGPESVELVEAHGTGTVAGDAAEVEALSTVFREGGRADRWCALGSVKSQVGHTKAAAGAAGLFKVVMALHHKVLPPTIKVDRPNPALALESSAFYLNTQARPWVHPSTEPRRASVSAFGFGGSNFHVTLEEYTGPAPRAHRVRSAPTELVVLSADSPSALAARCEALAGDAAIPGMLAFLARTTQQAFDPRAACRLSIVAESESDLAQKLRKAAGLAAAGKPCATPNGIELGFGDADGNVALLFPGQGSQYVQMGSDVAMTFSSALAAWDSAARVLPELPRVAFPIGAFSPAEAEAQQKTLTDTAWAQPAIGATSLSLLNLLRELGLQASAFGGHSFGEVTALHAAGVLSEKDFLSVARIRGELMAAAGGPGSQAGTMTSVLAPIDDLRAHLAAWKIDVAIANHNTPNQVVLSGAVAAIAEAEQKLQDLGITTIRLDVAAAFHSPLVSASAAPFREALAAIAFAPPTGDVYSNATASRYDESPDAIRATLAEQIGKPVRFVEQIEAMYARGIRTFVEVGPGRALTGMVSHILKGRPFRAVALDRKGRHGVTSLHEALGQLAVSGAALSFDALWAGFEPAIDPRTRETPKLVLKLNGANYGKPYPPADGKLPPPNPPRPEIAPVLAAPALVPEAPAPVVPAQAEATLHANAAWAEAFQESQRQTAEAHIAFQRSMAETHAAFLKTMEASFDGLNGMLGGAPRAMTAAPILDAPVVTPAPRVAPSVVAARPSKPEAPKVTPPPAPVVVAAKPAEKKPEAPKATPPVHGAKIDVRALLLGIVAAKTGYPEEMLGVDMDLESDLGVDSIKRVEILAAVRAKLPALSDLNPAEMRVLRTLAQIHGYLEEKLGGGAPSAATPVAAPKKTEPAPAPVLAKASTTPAPIGRFVVRAVPAPATGLVAAGMLGSAVTRTVFLTEDETGVARALVKSFEARGVTARVVSEIPDDADSVVFLGGLRPAATPEAAAAVAREAYRAAKKVATALGSRGGSFVTVQDTGGDFGLRGSARAWLGGLPGLVKSAAHEWPKGHLRALDVERGEQTPEAIAEIIAREIVSGGTEIEVGLRADGTRWTLEAKSEPAAVGELPLDARSVVVVSGGARGVTARTIAALAQKAPARFLLLGRTAPKDEPSSLHGITGDAALKRALLAEATSRKETLTPADLAARVSDLEANREIAQTLSDLRLAGADARYVAVDVTDRAAVRAAVAEARRAWGPVTGVIHGAGVIHDRLIAEKTESQFDRVFDTKVKGLAALLDATSGDPLRFLCAYSSVAARTGNVGQSDYAMANEILNKVMCAERARRPGLVVKSLNWGPWAGGMVTPALQSHFEARGVALIPIAEGAALLARELATSNDVEIVLGAALPGGRPPRLDVSDAGDAVREILIDCRTHPYLEDHRTHGAVVLPVAIVLDAFARLTQTLRPDLVFTECRSLAVLRGVRLAHFETTGDRFVLRARQVSNGDGATFAVELCGLDGAKHYTATTECRPRRPTPGRDAAPPEGVTERVGEVYGRTLFHGPAFQVIRSLEGVSREGAVGSLASAEELGWTGSFPVDPARIDGALQLALLWTEHVLGGASLPTAIGALSLYGEGLGRARVRCLLHRDAIDGERAVSDAVFVTEAGDVVAKLRGIETHLLPAKATRSAQPDA